ncbi:MAG: hypothetical protein Q9162_002107 [Coniocarpon cinnabarinum]
MSSHDAQAQAPPTPLSNNNANALLSSSPAFATPAHPLLSKAPAQVRRSNTPTDHAPFQKPQSRSASILPILLPPQTLRPIAFRTFTKKHNLTLTASSLATLATFIGKHCGSAWREEGLAEGVLEEAARQWKKSEGAVIVDSEKDNGRLRDILRVIEGGLVGGKVTSGVSALSRENSSVGGGALERMISESRPSAQRNESQDSLGMSSLDVEEEDVDDDGSKDVRGWLKTIPAFSQPQLVFNAGRKHFEKSKARPSMLPGPAAKTTAFRQRYHIIHQRVLRNESFQAPTTTSTSGVQKQWRITSVANLLGRGGSGHVLLGMLAITPTGTLALNDLTGSIQVDLDQAAHIDQVQTWICPGMIVLIEGVYEEDYGATGGSLAGQGGVGGTLGGKFIAFSIGAPKAEPRAQSLGLDGEGQSDSTHIAGGFGWVDFLGVGSERAVGSRMRKLEQKLLTTPLFSHHSALASSKEVTSAAGKLVVLGHVSLNDPRVLRALRRLFDVYTSSAMQLLTQPVANVSPASVLPTGFVFFGPFTSLPALSTPMSSSAAGSPDSRAYKEAFDSLAALLHDYAILLRHCTFHFIPSDNDPWPSAFSAGGAVPLPQQNIPDLFTTRVRREFAAANADAAARARESKGAAHPDHVSGEAVWTSNPTRLTLFGPSCEIVAFRDDATGRLRRNSIAFGQARERQRNGDGENEQEDEPMMSGARTSDDQESSSQDNKAGDEMDVDGDESQRADDPQPQPAPASAKKQSAIDSATAHARALTKTLLDQSYLSPYPPSIRPTHWAFAQSLSLYPLPSALLLCDAEAAAFSLVYQGCAVLNVGKFVGGIGVGSGRRDAVRWCEFALAERRGVVRSLNS